MIRAAAACLTALALAACGGSGATGAAGPTTTASPTASAGMTTPSATGTVSATEKPGVELPKRSTRGALPPKKGKNLLEIKVTITPDCALRGGGMLATVETAPGAAIALAVSYPDGQTYGQFTTGRAGPNGVFHYPWTIPPQAPAGEGQLLLGASDEENKKSNVGIWVFRIVDPGRSC